MPDFDLEGIEVELDDLVDEPETTDETDYKTKAEKLEEEKNNLLKALQEERKNKKKPAQKEEESDSDDIFAELKNYDEDTQKLFNKFVDYVKRETVPLSLDMQINNLRSEIPDILEYADEVKELAKTTKLSPKQAYYALRGDDLVKKTKTDIELEVANRVNTQPDNIDFSANASVAQKKKNNLSSDHLDAARMRGMDTDKFATALAEGRRKGGMLMDDLLKGKE